MNLVARCVLALLLLHVSACTSMQTVSVENAMQASKPRGIEYGSLVEVTMLDKQEVEFRVTEITDEGLGGQPGFFPYEDMKTLRVEKSGNKDSNWTAVLLGILGVAALVFLISNADNVSVCSPAPCSTPNP